MLPGTLCRARACGYQYQRRHFPLREPGRERGPACIPGSIGDGAAGCHPRPGPWGIRPGDEGIPPGGEERSHHRRGHHVPGAGRSEAEPVCRCQRLADIHDVPLRRPEGTITAARGYLRQPPGMPGDLYRKYLETSARRTSPEL